LRLVIGRETGSQPTATLPDLARDCLSWLWVIVPDALFPVSGCVHPERNVHRLQIVFGYFERYGLHDQFECKNYAQIILLAHHNPFNPSQRTFANPRSLTCHEEGMRLRAKRIEPLAQCLDFKLGQRIALRANQETAAGPM
jgi:hypothetical protein